MGKITDVMVGIEQIGEDSGLPELGPGSAPRETSPFAGPATANDLPWVEMILGDPEVRMDRRDFLTAAGSAATLTLTGTLARAAPADIYDLLDLLEETPRSQIIERVVARVHSGASYEDLLAALTLATVRNVQPYPDVGFKYHAVMVLQSIHFTGLGVPPAERWLPMLWAVDYFKEEQAEERHSSGWTMAARPSTLTPATSKARVRSALVDALDHWDLEAADAAVVNYASVAGPREVFELLGNTVRAIGAASATRPSRCRTRTGSSRSWAGNTATPCYARRWRRSQISMRIPIRDR